MNELVFLLDVDNTLLDNDGALGDLRQHLLLAFGAERQQRYWEIFDTLRRNVGYADYLGALQQYRVEHPSDPQLLSASLFLLKYPFADRVYPAVFELLERLRRRGPVVILSEGDVAFQPSKIDRAGLWEAVHEVLIYMRKEQMLDDVERRHPAHRYVMIDDKIHVLAAMKARWGERLTTVFVRQGHYGNDPSLVASSPPADVTVDRIGDLLELADTL